MRYSFENRVTCICNLTHSLSISRKASSFALRKIFVDDYSNVVLFFFLNFQIISHKQTGNYICRNKLRIIKFCISYYRLIKLVLRLKIGGFGDGSFKALFVLQFLLLF